MSKSSAKIKWFILVKSTVRNAMRLEINTKKVNKNNILCYFYCLNTNVVYEESLLIIHYFNKKKMILLQKPTFVITSASN